MRNHKLVPTTSSSSKNNTKQEQPHLSGAYIRSLVKQLSSSSTTRSKDHSTMGTKPHDQPQQEEQQVPQTTPSPQQQQQPHKKQVRRRLHTSRPYQERLLNMAEARREIVTALKIHRASMRQAKEQQQQQQQQLLQLQQRQEQQDVQVVHEQSQATRASAPVSYASFSDYLYNSPFANFTATSSYSSPLPYHTPVAPMVDGSDHGLDLLVPLPPQPLGLNLSFQDFNGVVGDDAMNTTSSFDPPFLQPSATSSYSVYSSPSVTMPSHDMLAVTTENTSLASDASLHRVLDDEEMAAIYSIGEQHDIEWSDTVNLVTSALWSELLESVEGVGDGAVLGQDTIGSVNTAEDALTHMPDWFSDSLGHQGTKDESLSLL